jgi:hypothetical protein
MSTKKWLIGYYGATLLFVLLDSFANLNIRAAFLESWPVARAGYYAFCFACLALILWRPAWATAVGTVESLISLIALILGMGIRIMVPNDAIFEEKVDIVTMQEIVNFIIVGTVAYFAWIRGMKALKIR